MIGKIFIALSLGVVAIGTASAATLNVYGCADCSLSQAKEIALQKATPRIICQAPHGQDEISEENQQCFSQPSRFHVLDKSRNRVYGFSFSHFNQGMQEWDLRLQVNEISVSAAHKTAILETAELYDYVEHAFEHLSNKLSRRFTSPTQTNFTQSRMTAASFAPTASSCSSNPSYQAMYNAFSPAFRSDLVIDLNREYNTLGGNHHARFNSITFSDSTFYASTNGIGVEYRMGSTHTNRYIEFHYNWSNIPQFPDNSLVFTLSIDDHGVDATLNERMTLIDGVSIRQLRDPLGAREGKNQISKCAREALDVFFDSSTETDGGGDGSYAGDGGGGGSGSGSGWPGGSSGGSGGPKCRQHYYWETGEIAFTMLVPCA